MTCPHPEKHKHRSPAAAWKALESYERRNGVDKLMRPYPCGDHWHLGHSAMSFNYQLGRALRDGRKNMRRRK